MEAITGYRISFLMLQLSISNLLRIFLLSSFLIILINVFWNRRKKVCVLEKLPSSQMRPYNFLGHMVYLKNMYIFKYPAPLHAYHTILMNGIPQVYGKDGLMLVWQIFRPALLVFHAESVEMILSHSTEIKKAWFYRYLHPWIGEGLLTSDGSKWKQKRKLLTPAFHFNILRDFLPVMNKQAKILAEILKHHSGSDCVNIVPLITKCSFDIICETILGEEMHSQTIKECAYLNSVSIVTEIVTDRILKPWLWSDFIFYFSIGGWRYRHYVREIKKFSKQLISRKKREKLESKNHEKIETDECLENEDSIYLSRKRKALLDLLLDEHINNNSISEEDIREEVDTFTFEGHDTTAMAMSWSLYMIGLYPDIQKKVHVELDSIFGDDDRDPTFDDLRDMKYLECVLKESLRLYPSVPGYGRQLVQDINFKGHFIPKGCTCFVWAYLLHRDPEVFPKPEVFDPDRFKPENSLDRHPFAYVPFSAGLRNCIGQKYAMMELKSVLSTVLRKYTVKSLQPRDKVIDIFEVVLRPQSGLLLEIRERKQ